MKSFTLDIFATDGCFYSGDCEHLIFQSVDGSRGVMAGHEPVLCALMKGRIKYLADGVWNEVEVTEGFVEIMPKHVRLFADTAVKAEEIDAYHEQINKERAAERERQRLSNKQYINSHLNLKRAMGSRRN